MDTPYYTLEVEEGDWVEYVVSRVFGMAMIPVEFESSFPRVWVSLNESSTFLVEVLEKRIVDFGNYSREFAIFNVSFNGYPLIPFWFFGIIRTVRQLPLDGYTFFMPTNESFWSDFKSLLGRWVNEAVNYGFQVQYDVKKCFYRVRADHFLIGWFEASANYDNYCGVLTKFSLSFALTQEFVNEIIQRIGPLTVNGEPFVIEAGKKYGIEIAVNDSNIAQFIDSVQFGVEYANLLDQAIEKGSLGAIISVKTTSENKLVFNTEKLTSALNLYVNVSLERIVIEANSTISDGKVLVINIRRDAIPVQWSDEFEVLINGVKVPSANDYEDVLNIDEELPEYLILIGPDFTHVAISIPHFSTIRIEILKIPSMMARLLLYLTIAGTIVITIFGVYIIKKRGIKHGGKS